MKKSRKPCREFSCSNLTRETYCDTHQEVAKDNATQKRRQYNTVIRDSKTEGFYQSMDWRRLRAMAIARDNYLCQWCLKNGELQRAQVVHHVVEVKEDWSKRLDLDNTESLCHACHNRHHKT